MYIVFTQGIIYVWVMINPNQYGLLLLDPARVVYNKEIWRVVTFLFTIPIATEKFLGLMSFANPIFAFFYVYLLYIYGSALETEWGSFGFTLFYLVGAVGTIVVGFLFGSLGGALYLNESIFLAFAALYPNFELLLFFFIPFKVKWLAWFLWAQFLYSLVVRNPLAIKAAIAVAILNYFLFFGKTYIDNIRAAIRRYNFKRNIGDKW